MGDGDGWVRCAQDHRHWGRYGAAGLMVRDGERVLLQHRAEWTHEGGTWALPGGARDSHEDTVETAVREAGEEAGLSPRSVEPAGLVTVDHGGWSYTTVLARPVGPLRPRAANRESLEVRWWPSAEVATLPLHAGFARTWPSLRSAPPPLTVVVDAANVVGSRPDGWWRDRPAATRRVRDGLLRLARHGLRADELSGGLGAGGLDRLLPRFVLVTEGSATSVAADPAVPSWWGAAVRVVAAPGSGDDAIVGEALRSEAAQILVVTADRGLRRRLHPAAVAVGPSWLTALLSAPDTPDRGALPLDHQGGS